MNEYELSGNENDADRDDEQNDETMVSVDDEKKHQLRLQNDWIARSLTSIGKCRFADFLGAGKKYIHNSKDMISNFRK